MLITTGRLFCAVAVILTATILAGQAFAQKEPDVQRKRHDVIIKRIFDKYDADGDGKISSAEARAGGGRLAEAFDSIDRNKDGYITRKELKDHLAGQANDVGEESKRRRSER